MQADFRWLMLASLGVLVSVVSVFAVVSPAGAYSASQTEAQSDPYAFPNVDLCCRPKPPRVPHCVRHPDAPSCICRRDPENPVCREPDDGFPGGWPPPRRVVVDCGAQYYPDSRVFTSLQEAVDSVRPWTTIVVRGGFPGGDCREHVRIDKSLSIEGDGNAPAIVNGCVTIAGRGRPTVHLRNLQILGTTTGLNGSDCHRQSVPFTGFDGHPYELRTSGDYAISALSVAGSTLIGEGLLVRSAQAALDADQSVVTLNGGVLAANPGARFSVRLDRAEVKLSRVTVAGGSTGISAKMLDRHPMTFDDIQLQSARSQYGEYSKGDDGVVVSLVNEGLPALPAGGAALFTWNRGSVQGFENAVTFDPGVSAYFGGAKLIEPRQGFIVRAGARVELAGNTIERAKLVGIRVDGGASGQAIANNISRKDGDCFCIAGECRDDEDDIDYRRFELRGNVCRREGSGWFGG